MNFIGKRLPDVELAATDGTFVNPSKLAGFVVIFCYPWTGRPGHPNPPGWDDIPGAHGSTPQALAYSKLYGSFRNMGVKLFGLSFQDTDWQQEFAARNALAFPLLSDSRREFSNTLGLPAFTTGGEEYLVRSTLIAEDRVIKCHRSMPERPEDDAASSLEWLNRT